MGDSITPSDGQRDPTSGRFLAGNNANPGGRPKGIAEVQRLAREKCPRAIERLGELLELEVPKHAKTVLDAAVALLDRGYGKPPQAITGEGGEGPVQVQVDGLLERLKKLVPEEQK